MSLDPEDWSAFRRTAHSMLDAAIDHVAYVRQDPLWREPEKFSDRDVDIPLRPTEFDAVCRQFRKHILPFGSGNIHPGFMGWVQGAGTPYGIIAELLAAAMNLNCGGRNHIGIRLEEELVSWMQSLFGFPESSRGLFLSGASQANFVALLCARTRAMGLESRVRGTTGLGRKLTAYASREVHGCVSRAMEMAGLGSENLRFIGVDECYSINLRELGDSIEKDRANGDIPFLLIGSAGTVNTGAIDDLDALANIAAKEKLWFHVDGALGAFCVASSMLKPKFNGIHRADSLAFDFHKWAHVPYDAGFLLTRDRLSQDTTFGSELAYLSRNHRGLAAGDWWPTDSGPDLSRGFRALKTWFTLKTLGIEAIGQSIEKNCQSAQRLARLIDECPDLERLAPVTLNIFCFRFRSAESDHINRRLVEALHVEGKFAPSSTMIDGVFAIRAAILNHRTIDDDIDRFVRSVLDHGRRICGTAS